MDLRAVLRAVRSSWVLVAVLAVAGLLAAAGVSAYTTPRYTTHMQFFVSTTGSATTSDAFQGSQFAQQRVASYSQLLVGQDMADRVIDRLGLARTTAAVQDSIEAEPLPETVLIEVAVTDTSAEGARTLADALAGEFTTRVEELETPPDGGPAAIRVTLTDAAEVPDQASEPNWLRNLALGLAAGLLLGVALAVGRHHLDRTITSADEAGGLAGGPVVGVVVRDPDLAQRHLADRQAGQNAAAEGFRRLRTNLQFLNVDEPPKAIMVSSAVADEGKTTVVVNLALALADAGRRVTIVEADLRKPKVTRYLGLVSGTGLTNVLAGSADVDEVLQKFGESDLFVLAAGPLPPNPGELLSSSQMSGLLDKLRAENDFVLVDAPPLLPVADSSGLSVLMDGVLLVVRHGRTRRDEAHAAATALDRVDVRTLGVVLNAVPPNTRLTTDYGYGYEVGRHAAR